MLTARTREWSRRGSRERIGGHELWVYRSEGEGLPLLFLHGFPSSSYDWRHVLERFAGRPAIAADFLGFGLSDKPKDHLYTLAWQADAIEDLAADAGPVYLVAHDMGTSVATELFAREIEGRAKLEIAGALLFNGSILLHRASPTISQKILRSPAGPLLARSSNPFAFKRQFARIFSDGHPLTPEEADDQWSLLAERDGHRLLHRTIHYMDERERLTDRWHGAIRDWPGDLRFAWALKDPVATTAVLDGLRELRPEAPVAELPEAGHYPQLEQPELIAAAIAEDLEGAKPAAQG
jgi:pimeloyl-ACP methyl ester carboxylesterase